VKKKMMMMMMMMMMMILDDIKDIRSCWKLKKEHDLNGTLWRTNFGRGCGPVAVQTE
jgi:hypothetical protein